MNTVSIACNVNGKEVQADVEARLTLADFLRDRLDLTGTHLGCEHGVCGACTVLLDGASVRSCLMFAAQANGHAVVTVEGVAGDGPLSRLQRAFQEHHALQCGYCTPGMITTLTALLEENPRPSADQVKDAISGNICRCTGYIPIVNAVLAVTREQAE